MPSFCLRVSMDSSKTTAAAVRWPERRPTCACAGRPSTSASGAELCVTFYSRGPSALVGNHMMRSSPGGTCLPALCRVHPDPVFSLCSAMRIPSIQPLAFKVFQARASLLVFQIPHMSRSKFSPWTWGWLTKHSGGEEKRGVYWQLF